MQRTISMGNKYFDSQISNKKERDPIDQKFIDSINSIHDLVEEKMNQLHISEALEVIFELLRKSNKYIDETTPWILAKSDSKKNRLETVLYHLLESIRVCACLLNPFLPTTSYQILEQINCKDENPYMLEDQHYSLNQPSPLFKRIEEVTIKNV